MSKKVRRIGIFVILAIPVFLVYYFFFHESVTFEDVSISPDGMYKCEVRETSDGYQSEALIKVYRRKNLICVSGPDLWELFEEEEVYNDSSCRSNYSIDWEYDDERRTTKLVVFGDFGTPPFPGEILLEVPLDSGMKAETSRQPARRSPPCLSEVDTSLEVRLPTSGKWSVSIVQDEPPEVGDWFRDDFVLTVNENGAAKEHRFQTSYAKFALQVIDLTGDGRPELVLIEGVGRGTSVRSERLKVLSVQADAIVELKVIPYSGYFGSGAQWWYEHEYVDVDHDGKPEIRLRLQHTPIGEGVAERPETIPRQEELVIDLG